MTKEEYNQVEAEYKKIADRQQLFDYRARKFFM